MPLIKEESESDFEVVSEGELEADEDDPEGTSIVVSDVSILLGLCLECELFLPCIIR